MKLKALFFGLVLGGFTFGLNAQTATKQINRTQVQQVKKIKQGVKTGVLTPKEAVMLKRQQKQIQMNKRRAKSDGVVTQRERMQIRSAQKRANRNIYRQKHDAQKRF